MRRLLPFIVLALWLVRPAMGQWDRLSVGHLTLEDGLTDYVVMDVVRDATGFLWIGTQGGLNRYDGTRIQQVAESEGLPDPYISALAEDPTTPGNLWIGTRSGLLAHYKASTGRVEPIVAAEGDKYTQTAQSQISELHVSPDGTVWGATSRSGLVKYDSQTARTSYYQHDSVRAESIPSNVVRALHPSESDPNTLWVGTEKGLARFDIHNEAFVTYPNRALLQSVAEPSSPSETLRRGNEGEAVTAILETDGFVWFATPTGRLYQLDLKSQRITYHDELFEQEISISSLASGVVRENRLWVGTRGHGVFALDTRVMQIEPLSTVPVPHRDLKRADVLSLEVDTAGLLWVGTFSGLYKVNLWDSAIRTYRVSTEGPGGSPASVAALHESLHDPTEVWVGTMREGLYRLDQRSGAYERFFGESEHPLNTVIDIYQRDQRLLWLGGTEPILYALNLATLETEAHRLEDEWGGRIYHIYEAPSRPGTLWISTHGAGLIEFDVQARTVRARHAIRGQSGKGESRIYAWEVVEVPGRTGTLWLATQGAGLHQLDMQTGASRRVRAQSGPAGCQLSDRIVSLAAEPDALWLGTFNDGLIRYDLASGTCVQYTRTDGLAYDDVGAIYIDMEKYLWMSTSNGLSRFDPSNEAFTTFKEADGLQGNIFYYPAQDRGANGKLYFGGERGFSTFHPMRIPIDTTAPNVVITRVEVDGSAYAAASLSDQKNGLTLSYNQNDVAFEFAALDLRQPDRNQYEIKLDGADDAWRSVENRTFERFASLAPGKYIFRVRATNSYGYWTEEGATFAFRIKPPFWKAWWFWSITGLAGVALTALAYQYRFQQLLRVERTRQRIADDLHDDIGSKISSVALRLDMVGRGDTLTKGQRSQLSELSRSARGVVDELRDAVWIVDAEYDNLPALVARMEQFANQILGQRLHAFDRPAHLPSVPLPMEKRRHIYLFYKEAIHNAARHSRADRVTVKLCLDEASLVVCVEDDGIGFDTDQSSSGRGLKTLHRRAEASGGYAVVDSAEGRGTSVRLTVEIL